MKKYLIIGAVIFVMIAVVGFNLQRKIIARQNEKIARLTENMNQVMDENVNQTTLILARDEVIGQVKRVRDSLAKALKIKPKWIEKIVIIDNSIHDTVKVPVFVTKLYENVWMLRDSTECFKYVSKLILKGDLLKAERQLLECDNSITQAFYKTAPRFWFIRTGKWKYLQKDSSRCGETRTKSITFIKK